MWEGRQYTRTGQRGDNGEELVQLASISLRCQSRSQETSNLLGLATASALKNIDDKRVNEPLSNESRIAPRCHRDQRREVDWTCQE